jgi:hypothetical protein
MGDPTEPGLFESAEFPVEPEVVVKPLVLPAGTEGLRH